MFRARAEDQFAGHREAGVRQLFTLGRYRFQDTLDGEGAHHHYVVDESMEGAPAAYEMDRETMYEFMARYLAGEYEMEEYRLEHSPAHDEMLDVLELATARARTGETDFSWDEVDQGQTEILDEEGDTGGEQGGEPTGS